MNVLEREKKVAEAEASAAPPVAGPTPVKPAVFSAEEKADFLAAEKVAARGVVGIMMAIFTAAVVGYTFIAWWVWMH